MLGALVFGGYMMVKSLGNDLMGDPAGGPSGRAAGSLVLRISGTPGLPFSGNITTAEGTENISGTLGAAPMDFEISGDGVAGLNIVTVNVRSQGTGSLKVELLENGQVVQVQETSAATGSISLTYSP
jgi:hypothetical protein